MTTIAIKGTSTITVGLRRGSVAGYAQGTAIGLDWAKAAIGDAFFNAGLTPEGHGLLDSYTLFQCHGYWQGAPEDSLRVEVQGLSAAQHGVLIRQIAKHLKLELQQDAVLVSWVESQGELV